MSRRKEVLADEAGFTDAKITMLLCKREAIFEIVQRCYDLASASDIYTDEAKRERFLDESSQIDSLRNKYEEIVDAYNARMLELDPKAKPDYQCLFAFESLYGKIKRISVQYTSSGISLRDVRDASSALHKARPKLAPIQLLEFDGDIKSWPMFYATFKSTVDDNTLLTPSEKLYYLLPKLTGRAKITISGITPCAENYKLILETLIQKYDDKRMLISAYLTQMFDFKPIQVASAANFDLFTDNFTSAVSALKNLKLDNLSDLIILHIALKKLDSETVRAFETKYGNKMPTFDEFVTFITTRSKVFERTSCVSNDRSNNNIKKLNTGTTSKIPKYQAYVNTIDKPTSTAFKCLCANVSHTHLYKCADFNKMTSPQERYKCVKDNNACVNCLAFNHKVSSCVAKPNCKVCCKAHHGKLHFVRAEVPNRTLLSGGSRAAQPAASVLSPPAHGMNESCSQPVASKPIEFARSDITLCATNENPCLPLRRESTNNTILLSTAQVATYDSKGKRHIIRVLLDCASQSHFITKECCDRLGIQLCNAERTIIRGFGGLEKALQTNSIDLKFYSRFDNNINFDISPLVVEKVTDLLPTAVIDTSGLSHLKNLPLADASFGVPTRIDALIGASLFPHLLLPDVHASRTTSTPVALRTVLGYVLLGSAPTIPTVNVNAALTCCLVQEPTAIDSLVRRFWDLEEIPSAPVQHPMHAECEDFYASTTTRDPVSGRYVVGLPFKDDPYSLGNSLDAARKRFMCLERKLEASPKLRSAYDDAIKDYLAKDYVSPAPSYEEQDPAPIYVIPHHGVVREDKASTKLRIVLDASSRSTSGRSLNDILHAGPNLQGDLFKIILNFRLHAVAMTADCRQQFLQIVMREADRRYQCFLYRFNPQDPLVLYQFNRVCFGLSSSPYHALRTVTQLVQDDGAKYPLASSIVLPSLYMDDVAFSLPNEREAVAASHQLIELFKGAQWDLVKWNSNSRAVLENIPATHKLPTEVEFDKSSNKILGLHWSTEDDAFYFKISPPGDVTCTKRTILSTVARLWDIMGFVAPTIVYAKMLIKSLWQLHLSWDEIPPAHIIKMWRQFCAELPALNKLRIPRHVGVSKDSVVTLLGLSDASLNAYGAVVYLHVSSDAGNTVRLVCAKSKVAPTKPMSIARLELCGALLLSRLLRTVQDNYANHLPMKTYAFLDSKVALYWIKSSPHRWQTFVANRVVQITENISPDSFFHCPGVENSADILSRGVTPEKLVSHPLWLNGPPWASLHPSQWPLKSLDGQAISDIPEQKVLTHTVCTPVKQCALYELALRVSSWSKLLRIIAYVCRFAKLLSRRSTTALTAEDLHFAENKILYALQAQYFSEEYKNIQNNKICSPAFNRLRPFIDNGVIRVGGRLVNSALDYAQMHPVILPRNDHVVNMIVDYYHVKNLHAGPETLMSLLRQRFWILSARRLVRQRVHKCNTCFRLKPRPTFPLMANLPDIRTRPAIKAFTETGCDFAGPIAYTPVRRRGVHSEKAWIVCFTCMTTRSCHLEVATSLSTPCFLAAFKRFLSRRGPIKVLHTDNATNFQGTASYLRDLYKFLKDEYYPKLEMECAESRITWKPICPTTPHFGSCWESMIKVTKTILFRVIGQQLLSYEELCTVLTQVECLLNSRPLTVLSSDPAEPSALTPSHFLHTAPLFSLPAPDVSSENISLLHRHALLDNLVQSFWNRWRMEYLHGLQVRQKWNTPTTPITPGTVVVVINDNVPPLAWPLAIVEKVHPSKDGIVRVATVKISGKTYLRPVVRLCPLPSQ